MPIANLMILEGRAPEVKQALIRAVTNAIVDSLLVKPESVRVIVQEIPPNTGVSVESAQRISVDDLTPRHPLHPAGDFESR